MTFSKLYHKIFSLNSISGSVEVGNMDLLERGHTNDDYEESSHKR